MRDRPTRPRAGFTLIELLVVVGIIAVILALLLPAVTRARSTAKAVSCAGNLRQIGAGLTRYTTETAHYPGWAVELPEGFMLVFPPRLSAMIGGDRSVFRCPEAPEHFEWPQDPDPSYSPAKAKADDVGYGYKEGEPVLLDWVTPISYGYNAWAGTQDPARGLGFLVNQTPEVRANKVKVPADMIAMADGNVYGGTLIVGAVPIGVGDDLQEFHHRGSNVLYCDGHVQYDRLQDINFDYFDRSSKTWPARRRWAIDHQPLPPTPSPPAFEAAGLSGGDADETKQLVLSFPGSFPGRKLQRPDVALLVGQHHYAQAPD